MRFQSETSVFKFFRRGVKAVGTLRIYDGDGNDDALQKNNLCFYFTLEFGILFGSIQCLYRY